MGRGAVDRVLAELIARCHAGLAPHELMGEVVARLGGVLTVDAVFCASVDPATLLFTGAVSSGIPVDVAPRFLANELLDDDVNKLTALASGPPHVDSLDRVTGNDRAASRRYREIMAPLGFGDDLRAAFRSGGQTWGFVWLHRESGPHGVSAGDARAVARRASHVGEGVRCGLLVAAAGTSAEPDGPGVLLVREDGSLAATTAAGERWLWELSDPDSALTPLPVAVGAVLRRLEAIRAQRAPLDVQPRVCVRTRSGRWALVHAAEIAGLGGECHVAVVVDAAQGRELAPLVLLAYGLTRREAEVAQLALRGTTNRMIARELAESEHTIEVTQVGVQQVSVSSRGELAARIYADQHARVPREHP